ncbi:Arc family DNA-binding protein [Massilia sp. RP-1-19]|uniref:Arc family DNA-binding protein n=1 Tax=Massilia polaris TaxID=2728846 RepID=A0A848HKN7_9BURK|nr:Arc family DNA-binding protein [Massilia polaris]NML61794.1 Arc family DNA-binding protein [Massilia polaris]
MDSPTRAAQAGEKYILRFDAGLKAKLKARAAQNRRSLNAELLLLIESGLAATEMPADKPQA